MVSIDQIEKGIASYLDTELMPNLPQNGIQKLIAGTAISLAIKNLGPTIMGYQDNQFVKMLHIMDNEGNVDIDTLKTELKKNMPEEGISVEVPVLGAMRFRKGDIDILYNHITGGGFN